ncbi:DoxX-like family protein [Pseudomonas sp. ABC1]|uniref:DoxX-like family protein n=1 Tax=Pseudomonas sp. ABC1 TaxID=2748080 RepID=UPI0015C3E7F3|nr:DoxX-like family protein [Pseudomonas sp. ABC1]QLF94336.1 DoxX-like family protein [Pseudomonas sp. ABC1]
MKGEAMVQLARYVIGLSWVYHGIFPKLLQVASLELAMTSSLGFPPEQTLWLIKAGGLAEVIFGVLFICCYRMRWAQLASIAGLVGLLLFAAVMTPFVLLEAFNPVTTNVPLIVLGVYLLRQQVVAGSQ